MMRMTNHSGRIKGSTPRHNDRQFDIDKASHINQAKMKENVYVNCYRDSSISFAEAERRFYAETFSEYIADVNERADKSRHKERRTSPEKMLSSVKTMPDETIFQIGSKKAGSAGAEMLMKVFNDFYRWHTANFRENITILDVALHMDETTAHIQYRSAYHYYDAEKGFRMENQNKALEALGIEPPNPAEPISRRNNRKQTYSAMCREKLLELCKENGLEIITEPLKKAPNEQNLTKLEYQIEVVQERYDEAKKEFSEYAAAVKKTAEAVEGKLSAASAELSEKHSEIEAAKGEIRAYKGKAEELSGNKYLSSKYDEIKGHMKSFERRMIEVYGSIEKAPEEVQAVVEEYKEMQEVFDWGEER